MVRLGYVRLGFPIGNEWKLQSLINQETSIPPSPQKKVA